MEKTIQQIKNSFRRKIISAGVLFAVVLSLAGGASVLYTADKYPTIEEILQFPEEKIDLGLVALIVEKEVEPALDIDFCLKELDNMAMAIRERTAGEINPRKIIEKINEYLFKEIGLKYQDPLYYHKTAPKDPKDAFLFPAIIDKKGNCTSFTTLYLALAYRLNLSLYPVRILFHNFPRYDDGKVRINIETTAEGKKLSNSYYIKYWKEQYIPMPREDIRKGKYLSNMSRKEYVGTIILSRGLLYSDGKNPDFDKAIKDYKKASELKLLEPVIYLNMGHCYNKKGLYEKAIQYFTKAIEIYPYYAYAYKNRAVVYSSIKNYEKALQDIGKSIEINPTSAEAYNTLGSIYYSKEDYAKAGQYYEKTILLGPEYANGHYNLGMVNFQLEKNKDALINFEKAIELGMRSTAIYQMAGICYANEKMYNEAITVLNKAIAISVASGKPANIGIYFNLGDVYYHLGKLEEARENYEQILKIDAKNKGAFERLQWLKEGKVFEVDSGDNSGKN